MIGRAEAARDRAHYRDAAILYAEALHILPGDTALRLLCGRMFDAAGDHGRAEPFYREAAALCPDDAEVALALGRILGTSGRMAEAAAELRRAARLRPEWNDPAEAIAALHRAGWRGDAAAADAAPPAILGETDLRHLHDAATSLHHAASDDRLVPELEPRPPEDLLEAHHEGVDFRHLGRWERSHWGTARTLRGVEAIRGVCITAAALVEVQLRLNGETIWRGPPRGAYPLARERERPELRKYVFNIWYDFSGFDHGRYELEVRLIDLDRGSRSRHEQVVVAAPQAEAEHRTSDAIVSLDPADARPIEAQIGARAAMVRPARRALLAQPPRTILVQRVDQLGDLIVSIPALRRLRKIFPAARLVGLLSPANAALAGTLGLFDEVVVADFPHVAAERRRAMPRDEQDALRRTLAPYRCDVAIDLSENGASRPLLLLSGAPFLYGFGQREFPWLSAEVEGYTHDAGNRHEVVPHTNKLVGFVEWLGAMLRPQGSVIRRAGLTVESLAGYGVVPGRRFALLHTGARLPFSRWPHYGALAALLLKDTDLHVVMMMDDADAIDLPAEVAASERFRAVTGQVPFDDLDALLSFCAVFVGNDSGPKHLASLRGAKVVSLHLARNNWNEWGQETGGLIVSRRVPCAGCMIWHEPEECGKDFACIAAISPQDVFGAVAQLL